MSLSTELRKLLETLREYEVSVDFCIESARNIGEDMAPEPEEQARIRQENEENTRFFREIVKSRREPTLTIPEGLTGLLREHLGSERFDEILDDVLTREAIYAIPGAVSRWKRLQHLAVSLTPDPEIANVLRQATTCFLWGLYDAAAILCRTSIELSVQTLLQRQGGMRLPESRPQDYLRRLIDLALRSRLMTPTVAQAAHKVRTLGNTAAHKTGCGKADVVHTLAATAVVVRHVYGAGR